MGCAATADGFVCTRRESDVLNRPQQFMGYEVSSGHREREYRFEREGDSYVYRPDSHNAVVLHEDGTVEIESGPKPSDALCILGGAPLPWDIPEIPHYQFQELQEETADVRRQLAERAEASRIDDALRGLSDELTAELERGTRSPAEQRRFLFLRWDECTESGGGLEARRIIEQLVRRRFPRDSPRQYTPAELEELNRGRASNAPFCPIGCP